MANNYPYFPFYAADFDIDTGAYTNEAIGVYVRLLIHQWINGSIPEDEAQLARISRCGSAEEFQRAWAQICSKFKPSRYKGYDNDSRVELANYRLEDEREKTIRITEQRRKAGKRSGEARKKHPPKQSSRTTDEQVFERNSNIQSQSQSQLVLSSSPSGEDSSPCPLEKILASYHAHCQSLARVKVFNEKRKKQVKARWKEDPARRDLEWWDGYFKYVESVPFLTGANDRGWQADFDFVTGPTGLIKIIEGKYDRSNRFQSAR